MSVIIHGQNRVESAALAGQTAAVARDTYAAGFNIPPDAQASVNGVVVTDDYVLKATDTIVFNLPTGQKG